MHSANDWLYQQARSNPQKIALMDDKQRLTYAELNARVSQTVGRLSTIGVRSKQRVAVLMPNCVEYVFLIHALIRLGAVVVPLNVRLTTEELQWQIEQSRCEFLACHEKTEKQAAVLIHSDLRVFSINMLGQLSLSNLTQHQPQGLNLEDVQSIVYTSGTTGQPKGAMLTLGNHFWSATASAFRLGVLPHDRWSLCMPLYHVGGLAIVLRSCLYGTTVVLQDSDPEAMYHGIETQQITLISLVPTMLYRLLNRWENRTPPASLRCVLLGGATSPKALLEQALSLGLPLATTYGLTEATSQVATLPPDKIARKLGSVGKPLMFSEIQILNDQDQQPSGEIGEIVVRGPSIMQGYDGQPEATEHVLRDGKLYTGDLGYLDGDGDLWVVQRRTDLIISGGENVYPTEVEQTLLEHPDVIDACVVGLDDPEWGQRVAAAVVLKPNVNTSESQLKTFCGEKLAGYKQPRVFYFYEELPKTSAGKTDRKAIARQLSKLT